MELRLNIFRLLYLMLILMAVISLFMLPTIGNLF